MESEGKKVRAFVKHKVSTLSESKNESATRAILAKLRRGLGKAPGSIPEIWDVIFEGLPEELVGKGKAPSYGERAIYSALTLYALHQQGKDLMKQSMCEDGESLGKAIRRLIKNEDDEKRIKRRFDAAATSDTLEEFSYHLRGLIQILKTQDIPLDYPALAEDLFWYQYPEARDSVRLRWGRDFYYRENDK
ncbi:MAG: type I-E CRISPR-associated protein Cse2/CasB [Desulfitobacteriia bacterium]|jgi:CRISPR system Cascade subunit CasB